MDVGTEGRRRLAVVVGLAVAFTFLGLETIPSPGTPTEMWASLASVFIWTAVVWDGRSRPGVRVYVHLAVQLALFVAVATLFGWAVSDSVWMGLTNVAGGFALALAYARVRRGAGWAPDAPSANLLLLALAAASGVVVALLGGYPHLEIGQIDRLTLWWIIRNTVYAYVGGVTLLGIFYGDRRPGPHRAPRWAVAMLVPLGAICLWLTYLDPERPLTWSLLLPALIAGSILTLRGAALYALFVAMGGALATLHPINQFGYAGFIPDSIIIDLLITTSTFITIHLAILRGQRVRATEQLDDQRRAAQEQAVLLRTVFETVTDGLVVLDGERRVVFHNHAARQLMGRRIPEGREVDWADYFGLTSLDGAPVTQEDLPGGSQHPDRFLRHLVVDNEGSSRVLKIGAWPLPGGDNRSLVLLSDVTAERERLSELTGFAGVVAHDLRSPLASLHGWLELAEDAVEDSDPETAAEFIARARVSSDRMRQVIEDWLAYTVQRDGLLTTSRVDLAELLEELVASQDASDVELKPAFALDVGHTVEADRVLTKQLLANLLGNAIKYTPEGQRPHVTVQSALDAEAGFVRVEVSDRGIGLPEGEEERVFDEFHRASAHADSYSGTGLGLSLCRRIVNRHGGSIRARNNPDGGATFSFTLPADADAD